MSIKIDFNMVDLPKSMAIPTTTPKPTTTPTPAPITIFSLETDGYEYILCRGTFGQDYSNIKYESKAIVYPGQKLQVNNYCDTLDLKDYYTLIVLEDDEEIKEEHDCCCFDGLLRHIICYDDLDEEIKSIESIPELSR